MFAMNNLFVHNITVSNDKDKKDKKDTYLSLRLNQDEREKYRIILELAQQRAPYINKGDLNRELLGIKPPKLLRETEIDFFKGNIDSLELSQDRRANILNEVDTALDGIEATSPSVKTIEMNRDTKAHALHTKPLEAADELDNKKRKIK